MIHQKQSFIVATMVTILLTGCAGRPLRPGRASFQAGGQFHGEVVQPENPAQSAAQNFERVTETELPLAAGTQVTEVVTGPASTPGQGSAGMERTVVLSQATVQKTRVTEKAGTVIGAAQKDTAREIGAKLSSLKGIVWVGVVMFVFGLASLFYPPLRAIVGSVTTSAAIVAGGLALMILPTLIVGNELLLLGGVGVGVGGWFLAHRHGEMRGKLAGDGREGTGFKVPIQWKN
jgi:hypothetical protein